MFCCCVRISVLALRLLFVLFPSPLSSRELAIGHPRCSLRACVCGHGGENEQGTSGGTVGFIHCAKLGSLPLTFSLAPTLCSVFGEQISGLHESFDDVNEIFVF